MAAPNYVNLSGFQFGISNNESNINCAEFSVEVEPEYKEFLMNIVGASRGFAFGDPAGKLTLVGEISSTGGSFFTAGFGTAFVPSNTSNYFGRSAGGWYLDRGTISQKRNGWWDVNAEFSSKPGIP